MDSRPHISLLLPYSQGPNTQGGPRGHGYHIRGGCLFMHHVWRWAAELRRGREGLEDDPIQTSHHQHRRPVTRLMTSSWQNDEWNAEHRSSEYRPGMQSPATISKCPRCQLVGSCSSLNLIRNEPGTMLPFFRWISKVFSSDLWTRMITSNNRSIQVLHLPGRTKMVKSASKVICFHYLGCRCRWTIWYMILF